MDAGLLRVLADRLTQEESDGITVFIADGAHDLFRSILYIFVDADDADIFPDVKEPGSGPAQEVGDTVLKQRSFNQLLAIVVSDLAELDFVIHGKIRAYHGVTSLSYVIVPAQLRWPQLLRYAC